METITYFADGTVLGDPSQLFRLSVFDEFLETVENLPYTPGEWIPIKFAGLMCNFIGPVPMGCTLEFRLTRD
jgi:hypothetical protein